MIRITRLTRHNITALQELLTDDERSRVTLGQTVAIFDLDLPQTQQLIATVQLRAAQSSGTAAHPYKSLFAVARKVNAATETDR